jgi:hypothetical protein
MVSLTESCTIPLDLDVKHLIGGTRLRLNGLVAALAAVEAAP